MLTSDEKNFLLRLARQSLIDFLSTGSLPAARTNNPSLLQPRATFVTLRTRATGDLRGCRGKTQDHRPLAESVCWMTLAAALDDPRFPPVTLVEVPQLYLEINALTPLKPIRPEEILIGKHGLLIAKDNQTGLLLPEVPRRLGWSADDFLRGICRKAHLPEDAWQSPDAQLFGFESEVWSEEDHHEFPVRDAGVQS